MFVGDSGGCVASIGDTRVLAQVSAELGEPRPGRPTEGVLYVNLELSPMASQGYQIYGMSEQAVELGRLLEHCIKDCRCLDMESLCVISGQKVWQIRLDVNVLNYEGAIMDCVSVAAMTALSHFKRPDITVTGEDVKIHYDDKDPVALSVHHMPLCVTFAIFDHGNFIVVDPSAEEENIMEGLMVVAMNCNNEICTIHMSGSMMLTKDQLLYCTKIAAVKVDELTNVIKKFMQTSKLRSESKEMKKLITKQEAPQQFINIKGVKVDLNQEIHGQMDVSHVQLEESGLGVIENDSTWKKV
ncbi:exosome complex component RRP45-like isoform X2 [Antedon mediterranea]